MQEQMWFQKSETDSLEDGIECGCAVLMDATLVPAKEGFF